MTSLSRAHRADLDLHRHEVARRDRDRAGVCRSRCPVASAPLRFLPVQRAPISDPIPPAAAAVVAPRGLPHAAPRICSSSLPFAASMICSLGVLDIRRSSPKQGVTLSKRPAALEPALPFEPAASAHDHHTPHPASARARRTRSPRPAWSTSPPRARPPAARRPAPASKAGLQAGDVVTKLGGTTINSSSDLVAAIADHAPGDQVKVTVRRGSRALARTVTLGTQPAQTAAAG